MAKSKVVYSIDDWTEYLQDDDISFATARITFLSTRPNSHKHIYTLDVLKEYSKTYLGKFIVAEYDELVQDTTTHTGNRMNIVGYVPANQEISFTQAEDGYWDASLDAVISKIYAKNVYEMFKVKNERSVSVEQLVEFEEGYEHLQDGLQDKVVKSFEGIGITILGLKYQGSVPMAKMEITKMSTDELENAYAYAKLNAIAEELNSVVDRLRKDNTMARKAIKHSDEPIVEEVKNAEDATIVENADVVENACGDGEEKDTEAVENACGEDETEVVENASCDDEEVVENAGDGEEVITNSEEAVVENAEDGVGELEHDDNEVEEKDDDIKDDEKNDIEDDEDVQMGELKATICALEETIKSQEAELSQLREYKAQMEATQKDEVVMETIDSIRDFISAEEMDTIKAQANEYSYENISQWKNMVLASVTSKVLMAMQNNLRGESEQSGQLIYDFETVTPKQNSIYD